ncbi:carbon dioxide concentrating mechanism/carboxysome shell protein [Synechococcus sp. PCC 7502]|uniref:carbon dioxide-concentrating mechanism protein CcmK n=1 Tax=Synechococcus sp. PCC 7502 TaxID=1173263 RepID=UPI00029FAD5E|nr:carbon dioxide-concentrating mechanism protein CcmK [Synechococcus sp. PCC 7502]AFY72561.1 carbon dioxide concentrating mechanism/carboxysome shell protein [Synechococcus sp. PCC 7502]
MALAVGVIETIGFPGILAAADAMVKSGKVTLVSYEPSENGQFTVTIRGTIAEVRAAVEAGVEAVEKNVHNGKLFAHYIVPNPADNVVTVLPIDYTAVSAPFQ